MITCGKVHLRCLINVIEVMLVSATRENGSKSWTPNSKHNVTTLLYGKPVDCCEGCGQRNDKPTTQTSGVVGGQERSMEQGPDSESLPPWPNAREHASQVVPSGSRILGLWNLGAKWSL